MSNTKRIFIRGKVPFDIYQNEEARSYLGFMNAPSFGIRIAFHDEEYVPNEHGGKTATYSFAIDGIEAVRIEFIIDMCQAFERAGGTIEGLTVMDIDGPEDLSSYVLEAIRLRVK